MMRIWLIVFIALFLTSCGEPQKHERSFTVISINDVYRIGTSNDGASAGYARLKTYRDQVVAAGGEHLLVHGGDFLYPSMLSSQLDGRHMIDTMNHIDGAPQGFDDNFFVVPGNHEFDRGGEKGGALLNEHIGASQFHWMTANVGWSFKQRLNLIPSKLIERGGIKVGLFGLTIDVNSRDYAPIDGQYVEVALHKTAELRAKGAEVVIGLTHLNVQDDEAILKALGAAGPDVIFGGHEHAAQQSNVNGRWVLKADADLETLVHATISVVDGKVEVAHKLVPLDESVAVDQAVAARVAYWRSKYAEKECGLGVSFDQCTGAALGRTAVELDMRSSIVRRYEAPIGNWVSDLMLDAYRDQGAQVAFMNSGNLRWGDVVPANHAFTTSDMKRLLPYNPHLRLIEITGAELKQVVARSVSNWKGSGHWLQVAGMAFRHDPDGARAYDLHVYDKGEWRLVRDDETIRAVTVNYVLDPNGPQDGYTFLGPQNIVEGAESTRLLDLVIEALKISGDKGISPKLEGRICNTQKDGPCVLN